MSTLHCGILWHKSKVFYALSGDIEYTNTFIDALRLRTKPGNKTMQCHNCITTGSDTVVITALLCQSLLNLSIRNLKKRKSFNAPWRQKVTMQCTCTHVAVFK